MARFLEAILAQPFQALPRSTRASDTRLLPSSLLEVTGGLFTSALATRDHSDAALPNTRAIVLSLQRRTILVFHTCHWWRLYFLYHRVVVVIVLVADFLGHHP